MSGPRLPMDPELYISAGVNPKTKQPIRVDSPCNIKQQIKQALRVLDEQDFVNRFEWFNLPEGLDAKLIERILYYRGKGMLFYFNDKFYFLPYCLSAPKGSTGIDVYGRFTGVTPLPFNGTANDGDDKNPWIQGLVFEPIYDLLLPEDYNTLEEVVDVFDSKCILLTDYTKQMSQNPISRQILNDPILDLMSDCLPYMRTALLHSTGVSGMRVSSEEEAPGVFEANHALKRAALEGETSVPIVGVQEFQELTYGNVAKAEEFLLAMQSLDNFRMSLIGVKNGGLFNKKSHTLQSEQDMNAGLSALSLNDCLKTRQDFCMLANNVFGLNMWCLPSEAVVGMDYTGDGLASNADNTQQKEPTMQEESNESV